MYNVLDICRYVINYSNSNSNGISNLKLQKILYFIQAYFLSETKKPCFSDRIEAWNFGPVVPKAYHEFKQYGASNIPYITNYIEYSSNNLWSATSKTFNSDIILENDKKRINFVLDTFANYSATDLVDLTHNQAPWKEAYAHGQNTEITISEIRKYFNV